MSIARFPSLQDPSGAVNSRAPGYAPAVSPYRSERGSAPETPDAPAPVRDAIDRMVDQFADELAFYRELVQNAIDAGATRVDVHLRWDPGEGTNGTMRISVTDDGSGMTQETVETCLLVLFRSTKERDPTKIGKFGVGFFSVFAIGPELVTVETGTGVGDGLLLTLLPSYKWELARAAPRKGTTVTLKVPYARDDVTALAGRSVGALQRWCPHVAIELWVTAIDPDGARSEARIDTPFDPNDGATLVSCESDGSRYSLAASADPATRFFNRGILLHETSELVAPGVVAQIDHPSLGHTISRDDVRRDAAFSKALARAKKLAGSPLRKFVISSVAQAADAVASAPPTSARAPSPRSRLTQLVRGALAYGLSPSDLTWPLVEPLDDGAGGHVRTTRFGRSARDGVAFASEPSTLTAALAQRGVPVVDVGAGAGGGALAGLLRECFPAGAHEASTRWGVAVPHTCGDKEQALLAALGPLLASVGIPEVGLVELEGLGAEQLFIALDGASDGVRLLTEEDVSRSPFTLFGARTILVSRRGRAASAACKLASRDPRTAAFLLARLLLLATDALDAKRDATLARAALELG